MLKFIMILIACTKISLAGAETLAVRTPNTSFTLNFEDTKLAFRSAVASHIFRRRPCNEALLVGFWKRVGHRVRRLPPLSGKSPLRELVNMNGRRYWLVPGESGQDIRLLPKEMLVLRVQEARACRSS
ncbi:MAG: hypothetical protein AB7G93_05590 [Bdellovibrionales bacterium]